MFNVTSLPPRLYRPHYYAPDFKGVALIYSDGVVFLVGRAQFYVSVLTVFQVKVFYGKLIIDVSYYHITVSGFQATVYDGNVAMADASFYHAVTIHSPIERCLWVFYQVTVKVYAIMQIVLGWGWEPRLYLRCYQQIQLLLEFSFYQLYF